LDIWAQAQGIEAKAGRTVSRNSNSRIQSFPRGCQGGKWQQDTLLPLCFLSWAILMTLPISHLTHPQCPHRHHTGWDEAYATLPRPAKEQSQLWLVISWCFSSSAQTLCPPRPEAFCTRDAIIFYPLASHRTAQAIANGTIPKGLFFFSSGK